MFSGTVEGGRPHEATVGKGPFSGPLSDFYGELSIWVWGVSGGL